jgi:hypothetical protein
VTLSRGRSSSNGTRFGHSSSTTPTTTLFWHTSAKVASMENSTSAHWCVACATISCFQWAPGDLGFRNELAASLNHLFLLKREDLSMTTSIFLPYRRKDNKRVDIILSCASILLPIMTRLRRAGVSESEGGVGDSEGRLDEVLGWIDYSFRRACGLVAWRVDGDALLNCITQGDGRPCATASCK